MLMGILLTYMYRRHSGFLNIEWGGDGKFKPKAVDFVFYIPLFVQSDFGDQCQA